MNKNLLRTLILEGYITEKTTSRNVEDDIAKYNVKKFLKKINELGKYNLFIKFLEDLPNEGNLYVDVLTFLSGLSTSDVDKYAKAFKSYKSVPELNNTSYESYKPLWNIYVGQAMGKGEVMIAFLVKNAVAQGAKESFDILDRSPDGSPAKYEVKSLSVGKEERYGAIRPGAEAKVSKFPFTAELNEFYKIVTTLQTDENVRSAFLKLGDTTKLQSILNVIDKIIIRNKNKELLKFKPGDISKGNLLNLTTNLAELKKLFKSITTTKDTNLKTGRLKISGGKTTGTGAFWIDPDDVDAIFNASGTNKKASIKIGPKITDESSDAKALLIDLLSHPFITKNNYIVLELSKIKKVFFGEKSGLIYFLSGKTYVSDMSAFATIESSQDGYRFGLISKYPDYPYIQAQAGK